MKNSRLLVALPAVIVLAGCGGDPTPSTTPTATGSVTAAVGTGGADCVDVASSTAQAHGDRVFVEAGGTTYTVVEARALPGDRVIVATTVDQPELVGYDQVQFLSQCADGDVVLLGGYVPIDGSFELLFTTDEGQAAGDVPMTAP
jgi:hypothetical protein